MIIKSSRASVVVVVSSRIKLEEGGDVASFSALDVAEKSPSKREVTSLTLLYFHVGESNNSVIPTSMPFMSALQENGRRSDFTFLQRTFWIHP